MEINLGELYNKGSIFLDSDVTIDNIDSHIIKKIENLHINGYLKYTLSEEIEVNLAVTGKIIIPDAITLEDITYPLSFAITEIYDENSPDFQKFMKNKQNILDINEILWENIVLEVPISVTNNSGLQAHGNGWELNGDSNKKES